MPSLAATKASARNILRRFRRSRAGSAAVEFALVAPVFFALLFAIIEVAIMFFASQVLETITQDSARALMTGQAQTGRSAADAAWPPCTQAPFQTYACTPDPGAVQLRQPLRRRRELFVVLQRRDQQPDRRQRQFHQCQHAVHPGRPRRHGRRPGCSINGRCSSPVLASTSRICPATSACWSPRRRSRTSLIEHHDEIDPENMVSRAACRHGARQ